jgi:hypothetical protein
MASRTPSNLTLMIALVSVDLTDRHHWRIIKDISLTSTKEFDSAMP